eukprot:m.297508 g.297508  ORF g.297508 m.297508 type:complete len:210 (+) comp13624_c0_seq1:188-817(+)
MCVKQTALVLLAVCALAHSLSFDLDAESHLCLQEDVHKGVLVVGEYDISDDELGTMMVNLEITDSRGHPVYRKEDASKGKFAFTSDDYDVFEICFNSEMHDDSHAQPDQHRVITLDLKLDADARNYDELAKASKLKPMEIELKRLEDLAESIVQDFARMKQREIEHRDTNESTNERMLTFSVISMLCLLALAVWQVLYLKRYFKSKNLI